MIYISAADTLLLMVALFLVHDSAASRFDNRGAVATQTAQVRASAVCLCVRGGTCSGHVFGQSSLDVAIYGNVLPCRNYGWQRCCNRSPDGATSGELRDLSPTRGVDSVLIIGSAVPDSGRLPGVTSTSSDKFFEQNNQRFQLKTPLPRHSATETHKLEPVNFVDFENDFPEIEPFGVFNAVSSDGTRKIELQNFSIQEAVERPATLGLSEDSRENRSSEGSHSDGSQNELHLNRFQEFQENNSTLQAEDDYYTYTSQSFDNGFESDFDDTFSVAPTEITLLDETKTTTATEYTEAAVIGDSKNYSSTDQTDESSRDPLGLDLHSLRQSSVIIQFRDMTTAPSFKTTNETEPRPPCGCYTCGTCPARYEAESLKHHLNCPRGSEPCCFPDDPWPGFVITDTLSLATCSFAHVCLRPYGITSLDVQTFGTLTPCYLGQVRCLDNLLVKVGLLTETELPSIEKQCRINSSSDLDNIQDNDSLHLSSSETESHKPEDIKMTLGIDDDSLENYSEELSIEFPPRSGKQSSISVDQEDPSIGNEVGSNFEGPDTLADFQQFINTGNEKNSDPQNFPDEQLIEYTTEEPLYIISDPGSDAVSQDSFGSNKDDDEQIPKRNLAPTNYLYKPPADSFDLGTLGSFDSDRSLESIDSSEHSIKVQSLLDEPLEKQFKFVDSDLSSSSSNHEFSKLVPSSSIPIESSQKESSTVEVNDLTGIENLDDDLKKNELNTETLQKSVECCSSVDQGKLEVKGIHEVLLQIAALSSSPDPQEPSVNISFKKENPLTSSVDISHVNISTKSETNKIHRIPPPASIVYNKSFSPFLSHCLLSKDCQRWYGELLSDIKTIGILEICPRGYVRCLDGLILQPELEFKSMSGDQDSVNISEDFVSATVRNHLRSFHHTTTRFSENKIPETSNADAAVEHASTAHLENVSFNSVGQLEENIPSLTRLSHSAPSNVDTTLPVINFRRPVLNLNDDRHHLTIKSGAAQNNPPRTIIPNFDRNQSNIPPPHSSHFVQHTIFGFDPSLNPVNQNPFESRPFQFKPPRVFKPNFADSLGVFRPHQDRPNERPNHRLNEFTQHRGPFHISDFHLFQRSLSTRFPHQSKHMVHDLRSHNETTPIIENNHWKQNRFQNRHKTNFRSRPFYQRPTRHRTVPPAQSASMHHKASPFKPDFTLKPQYRPSTSTRLQSNIFDEHRYKQLNKQRVRMRGSQEKMRQRFAYSLGVYGPPKPESILHLTRKVVESPRARTFPSIKVPSVSIFRVRSKADDNNKYTISPIRINF